MATVVDRDEHKAGENPKPSQNDDDGEHYCVRSEHVLAQILTKLPLKPLFSFKSVSKRWNSLISSPSFSVNYIAKQKLDSPFSSPWTLLRHSAHDVTLHNEDHCTISSFLSSTESSNDELIRVTACDSPFPTRSTGQHDRERYQVVASSDGLLLCRSPCKTVYAICNSVTRQWTLLPRLRFCYEGDIKALFREPYYRSDPPHNRLSYENVTEVRVSEAFVTKVEPSSSKIIGYKVFLLRYGSAYRDAFDMKVYDSETKIWTESKLEFSFTYRIASDTRPICLNGIIHWKVWIPMSCVAHVATYDPYKLPNQEPQLIWYPTIKEHSGWDDFYNHIHTLIDAFEGKLHYLAIDTDIQVLAIWVLEDYHEDGDGWCLKHRFNFNCTTSKMLRSRADYYKPLAFHPFDSNIIYLLTDEEPNKVMSYDISRETVSPISVSSLIRYPDEVFLFVLPLWPPTIDC